MGGPPSAAPAANVTKHDHRLRDASTDGGAVHTKPRRRIPRGPRARVANKLITRAAMVVQTFATMPATIPDTMFATLWMGCTDAQVIRPHTCGRLQPNTFKQLPRDHVGAAHDAAKLRATPTEQGNVLWTDRKRTCVGTHWRLGRRADWCGREQLWSYADANTASIGGHRMQDRPM